MIAGVRIGHWTDTEVATGCTVVLPPPGTIGAVDVRGGGASTRELELMHPAGGEREVSALLLTGGSAFGLAAAQGVAAWCEEHDIGLDTGAARVPIVPAAVIYDLGISANARRPGADEGRAACLNAHDGRVETGCVGAGTGATVGKARGQAGWCKGGLGYAEESLHDGVRVAALAVVNAFGDVVDERGDVIAGTFHPDRGFVGTSRWSIENPPEHRRIAEGENTTLVCVLTDARLSTVAATQVARAGSAGVCQAVHPAGTAIDGDVTFCLATGRVAANAAVVGLAAAEVVARAVRDGVRSARTLRGVPTGEERLVVGQ